MVIVTSAVISLVLVAMVFANNFLNARMAENEFSTNKQFMLTTSLQIDDIAWTIGRTQTVRYSSRYGQVGFQDNALNYAVEVDSGSGLQPLFNFSTGAIMFNTPVSQYTLGNNYFERVHPTSNGSFVQEGPTAPISHVYVIEKLPMSSGNFTRVVVAPTVRMMPPSIINGQTYVRFYLPLLEGGSNPMLSQSITLVGKTVSQYVRNATQIKLTATFPQASEGIDPEMNSSFFNFESDTITFPFPDSAIVEFYVGEVTVSLGLYV
jgi:hypothetical protein